MKYNSLLLAVGLSAIGVASAAMVESVGRAAGDDPAAREVALSDALREAVRC